MSGLGGLTDPGGFGIGARFGPATVKHHVRKVTLAQAVTLTQSVELHTSHGSATPDPRRYAPCCSQRYGRRRRSVFDGRRIYSWRQRLSVIEHSPQIDFHGRNVLNVISRGGIERYPAKRFTTKEKIRLRSRLLFMDTLTLAN